MKKLLFLVIMLCFVLQLTGCISYVSTGIPVYNSLQNRQKTGDSVTTQFNTSISYTTGQETNLPGGSVSVHQSRFFKNLRLTYGAFSYAGNNFYTPANPIVSNTYGLGFNAGTSYSLSTPDAEWKIIGTEVYLQKPVGSFSPYPASENSPFQASPSVLVTPGLTSEVLFKNNRHPFGLKFFAGKPFGKEHDSERYVTLPAVVNASSFVKHKNVTAFAQLQISPKINLTFGFSYTFRKKLKNPGLYKER
jgi:hypothetical protein